MQAPGAVVVQIVGVVLVEWFHNIKDGLLWEARRHLQVPKGRTQLPSPFSSQQRLLSNYLAALGLSNGTNMSAKDPGSQLKLFLLSLSS